MGDRTILGYTATTSISGRPQSENGWRLEEYQENCHICLPCSFVLPQTSASGTFLGHNTGLGCYNPPKFLLPLRGAQTVAFPTLFVCMHIAQESCKCYSPPERWLSVDTKVSASQVLLRTLHAVCVLDSGFCCFSDDWIVWEFELLWAVSLNRPQKGTWHLSASSGVSYIPSLPHPAWGHHLTWSMQQVLIWFLCQKIVAEFMRLYLDSPISKLSVGPSHSGINTFSRGISCGISRVIATLIINSPGNCPTPLNTLAYFLIRSPALCQLRWSNSHFHYHFDQFNIQPAQGLSSSDDSVCTALNLQCFTSYSVWSKSTPSLSMSPCFTFLLQRWVPALSSFSQSCCCHTTGVFSSNS